MDEIGSYQLEAVIGRGTSATVWRARSSGPVVRTVALKRCRRPSDEAARSVLRDEASLLAELDHPHIVAVLDVVDDGASVAIAMPLARGGTLRSFLDGRGPLSAGELVGVIGPVADALGSAHRHGVVHGDVKPANILFSSDGEPLLSDFGVARHLGRPSPHQSVVAGTACYLDPELFDGIPPGPSSDLYALAIVCYEALTGRRPHDDDAALPPGLAEAAAVPPALAEFLDRALSRQSHRRPPSAAAFAAELRACVDGRDVRLPLNRAVTGAPVDRPGVALHDEASREPGTRQFGPRPPSPPATEPAPARRRRPVIALGLVALIVALAGMRWVRHDHGGPMANGRAAGPVPDRAPPCPSFPRLAVGAAQHLAADVNGDGCGVPLAWDGRVLVARFRPTEVQPRSFRLGKAGDILLFGDWNCDGAETPALYRPTEGTVRYLDSFALRVGDRRYADREVGGLPRDGRARVVRARGRCDTVSVVRSAR